MPQITNTAPGRAGVGPLKTAAFNFVASDGSVVFKVGGGVIASAKARDPGNTPDVTVLRTGTLMARNATTNRYGVWSIGTSTAAITGTSTTINVSVASAVELVRRIGTSGTFRLIGSSVAFNSALPTTVNSVRTVTVTYSGVNTSTGDITVTAIGALNQIDHIRFNAPSTGGNLQLTVQKTDYTFATTANAAWSATDATYLSNIQTQLDTSTGVSNGIVVSAISGLDTDHGLQLTYSGTGYAGKPWTPVAVAVYPTGSSAAGVSIFQQAAGSFISGSVLAEASFDVPTSLIVETSGIVIPTDGSDRDWSVPVGAQLTTANILPWPSDTGMRNFIKDSLSTTSGGKFLFDDSI